MPQNRDFTPPNRNSNQIALWASKQQISQDSPRTQQAARNPGNPANYRDLHSDSAQLSDNSAL